MAHVLAEFEDLVVKADGVPYRAQAVGRAMSEGLWEGWIEFIPTGGGPSVRSPRETTQPNRRDAEYWAAGLSAVYLEGALSRALNPLVRHTRPASEAQFDGPAQPIVDVVDVRTAEAVLDPFSVYAKGETLLRKELSALRAWHLVNIIVAYRLSDDHVSDLNRLPESTLVDIIVSAVRETS